MLGSLMPSDIIHVSTVALASDSVETRTNNPLLYYVTTTNQGI